MFRFRSGFIQVSFRFVGLVHVLYKSSFAFKLLIYKWFPKLKRRFTFYISRF